MQVFIDFFCFNELDLDTCHHPRNDSGTERTADGPVVAIPSGAAQCPSSPEQGQDASAAVTMTGMHVAVAFSVL